MNYWSIETSLLGSKAFASVPAAAVGTWLRLMAYAVEQELPGGVIEGLGSWDPRELLVTIACDPLEVLAVCKARLAHFEDGDLHIHHFPAEEMAALHAKREGGKNGGRPRSNPEKNARKTTTETMPETMPETIPLRIGKDRIGEERRREDSAQGAGSPLSDSEFLTAAEKGNEAAAIARSYPANGSESRAIAAIVRLLASGTVTPDDLRAKVALHASRWHALPARLQGFCPGRVAYFEDSRWNDDPNLAPWIDPDVSQTEVPAPKKNKSAAQQETEARRMAIAREMWPELAEFLPWESLSPEQRLRVQQEDQRREAERRAAA